MFNNKLPPGSMRQKKSGALIFPVHPRELEAEKNREELKKELAEVRQLKEELLELKNDLSEEE